MTDEFQAAVTLQRQGQLTEAEAAVRRAVAATPENADAWHLLGVLTLRAGRAEEAVTALGRATSLNSGNYVMHVNHGSALRTAGRPAEGRDAILRALALNPGVAEAEMTLAQCLKEMGRLDEAEAAYTRTLALRPNWPDAMEERAFVLQKLGRYDDAAVAAEAVLAVAPQRVASRILMGDLLQRRGDFQPAVAHYRRAVAAAPENASAHNHLAVALGKLGQVEDAVVAHRQAFRLLSDDLIVEFDLGIALLLTGRLAEGWPRYAARHRYPGNWVGARKHHVPSLTRAPAGDNRVFVWADQGLGDEILFAQMVPDLIARGARVTLECEERLAPLFARSFPDAQVVARTPDLDAERNGSFDAHIALGDLGTWLRPGFGNFPQHNGYLRADPGMRAGLRRRYQSGTADRPLVGLSWRTAESAKVSAQKSVDLPVMIPALQAGGRARPAVKFVSLQYGDPRADIAAVAAQAGVEIVVDPEIDPLRDLDAFAAQVAAMDLVITTSNTTAHMAGALNVPCWVLVPIGQGAMWHWFLGRSDSPWYPSVRLFRQVERGDWAKPVGELAAALAERVRAP